MTVTNSQHITRRNYFVLLPVISPLAIIITVMILFHLKIMINRLVARLSIKNEGCPGTLKRVTITKMVEIFFDVALVDRKVKMMDIARTVCMASKR